MVVGATVVVVAGAVDGGPEAAGRRGGAGRTGRARPAGAGVATSDVGVPAADAADVQAAAASVSPASSSAARTTPPVVARRRTRHDTVTSDTGA